MLKTFRVTKESYIQDSVRVPGEIVQIDTSVMKPGTNLEPVKAGTDEPDHLIEEKAAELSGPLPAEVRAPVPPGMRPAVRPTR